MGVHCILYTAVCLLHLLVRGRPSQSQRPVVIRHSNRQIEVPHCFVLEVAVAT
jgi:hypothetical protein